MKNKNTDLRNIIFEQIERINDDDLTQEEMQIQIEKSKAINNIAKSILQSAKLEYLHHLHEGGEAQFFADKKIKPMQIKKIGGQTS